MKTRAIPFGRSVVTTIVFTALLFVASPLQAANILVIGDSWGVAAGPALQAALLIGTPEQVNLASQRFSAQAQALADEKGGLGDPGHRWLIAQGDYVDDQAVLDLFNIHGGLFDTSQEVTADPYGTIVLTFSDCNTATVEYDIPSIDAKGKIEIERVASDNIALCETLSGTQ